MATSVTEQRELGRLARAVEGFKARYARLASTSYGAAIARSGDNALMAEYGRVLADAQKMKRRIETVEGLWLRAKQWAGLGALPIALSIGAVVALVAAIASINATIDRFTEHAAVKDLMRRDRELTQVEATRQVKEATERPGLFDRLEGLGTTALWLAAGVAAWWVWQRK